MAENTYSKLSDAQLVTFIAQAGAAFTPTPANYGLTAAQVTALTTAGTDLDTSITAATAAEAAFRSAIQDKNTKREAALSNVQLCAGLMYATPNIKASTIAAAGFQPHDTSPTPILPQEPTALVAFPNANGTTFLSWERNGNPYGVEFVIETSPDGAAWTQSAVTKKKSYTMDNCPPGVAKWFRVKATNRGLTSVASTAVAIYDSGETVQLQIAA